MGQCQVQHWKEAGTTSSAKNKKAGGAEQYNANKKYTEAVAVAAACARTRRGGRAHLHASTPLENEGGPCARVRVPRDGGLRPRFVLGGAGEDFVLRAGDNLNEKVFRRWARWTCVASAISYHGVVACALGWACWKTYVGRSEEDR